MPTYTIDEWIADYRYAASLVPDADADPIVVSKSLQSYFYSKYPDYALARYHLLFQALRFVETHMDALSFGRAAVAGETHLMIGRPLLVALHEYFIGLADMNRMPSVQEIIAIAKRHGA